MTKKVELHQINITILLKVIDGDRSDGRGLRQAQTAIFCNSDAEWADARQQVENAVAQLQAQLDQEDSGGSSD